MEFKRKRDFDHIRSACILQKTSTTSVLTNILIVNVVLVIVAYIAFFRMQTVYAKNLKAVSFNAYETKIVDEMLESYTDTSLKKDFDDIELLTKEDLIVKPVYHSDCNYYMYSGRFSSGSLPAARTWAHAYDLYYSGKIHGAYPGRWCTFFAQMWFYDIFGFNSSNGPAGNGNTFASNIYNSAVYYDEDGRLKHYFKYTDHPETMSVVSIYSSLEEGHVLCVDEVDYENNTITISEGNSNGKGDVRIRQTMTLGQFYAANPGYKVYVSPTEELLKMISSN